MLARERNALLVYVFLVIFPICGLVGVIRAGRHLKAPAGAAAAKPADSTTKGTH